MKKFKFIGLIVLLLFARGCDFYSTSLWISQENGLEQEMNWLTQLFGVGWNGLITVNIILITLIIYLHYRYTYHYAVHIPDEQDLDSPLTYASYLYFGNKNSKFKLLYRMPQDKRIMLAHLGYTLIRFVIIASLIATIHNLNQYYDLGIYKGLSNTAIRPLYLIYSSLLLSFLFFTYRLWSKEYKLHLSNVTKE